MTCRKRSCVPPHPKAVCSAKTGAYEKLSERGLEPAWVSGISIGATNAAIICGNPPERRAERLREFWHRVTLGPSCLPWLHGSKARAAYGEMIADTVVFSGTPGFFRPRLPAAYLPFSAEPPLSYHDTAPLRRTLEELIDFDYLNAAGPRLSIGAVDLETANFTYFDNARMRIGPEHIMASGALPPGFALIEVDGRQYWDGGLVSNTPLQFVMDNLGADPVCIFQVDVFSARGEAPKNLVEVALREKDIRYSSRTRLTTDRYRQLHDIHAAAERLAEKLPEGMKDDPDLAYLRGLRPAAPITLVQLIHRKEQFESQAKDYEFSRLSMQAHWNVGAADTARNLNHAAWKARGKGGGLQVFDFCTFPKKKGTAA